MRQDGKNRGEFKSRKTRPLLTGSARNKWKLLEERLAELEKRVEGLERHTGVFLPQLYRTDHKKRPGPEAKIFDIELLHHRDALVNWLEEIWPKLVHQLFPAGSPRAVAAALKPFAEEAADLRPLWQRRFLAHPARLLDFLRRNRFKRKPTKSTVVDALNRPGSDERRERAANRLPTRRIANAMAGVPQLRWRRSLDRCSKRPSHLTVGLNTDAYYREMFGIPVLKPKTPKA